MAGVDWISVWETAGGTLSVRSVWFGSLAGTTPSLRDATDWAAFFGLPFYLLALSVFLVVALEPLEELPFFFGGFWPPLADLEDHLAGFGQWVPGGIHRRRSFSFPFFGRKGGSGQNRGNGRDPSEEKKSMNSTFTLKRHARKIAQFMKLLIWMGIKKMQKEKATNITNREIPTNRDRYQRNINYGKTTNTKPNTTTTGKQESTNTTTTYCLNNPARIQIRKQGC